MDELNQLLENEIKAQIKCLSGMPPGSDEAATTAVNIAKLCQVKTEIMEQEADISKNKLDKRLKLIELCLTAGMTLMQFMLTFGFNWHWMREGLEFEKTGTFTSNVFKSLINRFKVTKF